jgi:autotransporter adhesin
MADHADTMSMGSTANERQITNVAAGPQGTDVLNVDQLNQTVAHAIDNLPAGTSEKDYTNQRFNPMQHTANQIAKNAYAGAAAAMAMPNLTPSQPLATRSPQRGAGMYKNGSAVDVGAA